MPMYWSVFVLSLVSSVSGWLRALDATVAGRTASDTAANPVLEHGRAVTIGRFLTCWEPALGLTEENCCSSTGIEEGACFDDLYTAEHCCQLKPDASGCITKVREEIQHCMASVCRQPLSPACDAFVETESCAQSCGIDSRASYGFGIAQSNGLGRALWCLAQRPDVHNVMDLFIAEGDGSAAILAQSLANVTASSGEHTMLSGFERDEDTFALASARLAAQYGAAAVTQLRINGSESVAELAELSELAKAAKQKVAVEKAFGVLLVKGEPYPDGGASATDRLWASPRMSALQAICDAIPIDFVFFDGPPATDAEFAIIEQSCRPLRWVVVNNVNLPGHGGWIREHLLTRPFWAEVLTGRTFDRWAAGADLGPTGGPIQRLYRVRAWTALARVPGICPGFK